MNTAQLKFHQIPPCVRPSDLPLRAPDGLQICEGHRPNGRSRQKAVEENHLRERLLRNCGPASPFEKKTKTTLTG